jgi:hypothetical protein
MTKSPHSLLLRKYSSLSDTWLCTQNRTLGFSPYNLPLPNLLAVVQAKNQNIALGTSIFVYTPISASNPSWPPTAVSQTNMPQIHKVLSMFTTLSQATDISSILDYSLNCIVFFLPF